MKKTIVSTMAVVFFSAVLFQGQNVNAAFLPDLVIKDKPVIVGFNQCSQQSYKVRVVVTNIGNGSTNGQPLKVDMTTPSFGFRSCVVITATNLDPGDSTTVECYVKAQYGMHENLTVAAVVNGDQKIQESNSTNNYSPVFSSDLYIPPMVIGLKRSNSTSNSITWAWAQSGSVSYKSDSYDVYIDNYLVKPNFTPNTHYVSYTAMNLSCSTSHTIKVVPKNPCATGSAAQNTASTLNSCVQ